MSGLKMPKDQDDDVDDDMGGARSKDCRKSV